MKRRTPNSEMAILVACLTAMIPLVILLAAWITAEPIVDMRL